MFYIYSVQYVLYTTKWNSNSDVLKGLTNSAYCTYKNRPRYHGNLSSMMFNRQNFVINVLCHLVKKNMFFIFVEIKQAHLSILVPR